MIADWPQFHTNLAAIELVLPAHIPFHFELRYGKWLPVLLCNRRVQMRGWHFVLNIAAAGHSRRVRMQAAWLQHLAHVAELLGRYEPLGTLSIPV